MALQSPEDQLAYLGFRRFMPHPALQAYVRSYWYFKRDTPLSSYHEEYMHPTGGYGIIFNFGDALSLDQQALNEPIFLDGVNTLSRKMGFYAQVELMGIRFHEGGAYPFMAIPLHELKDQISILDALDSPQLLQLHLRLAETQLLSERIKLLDDWLISRLTRGKERHPIIPLTLSKLRMGKHLFSSIPNLAEEFAISQRQLERLYKSQVGMSPIQYSQLLRVEAARLALKRLKQQSNTRLAVDLGFYDQSHLIREFKAVIGMTPYQYMKRSNH